MSGGLSSLPICQILLVRIRDLAPSLLLDLGGHTADNHPALLHSGLPLYKPLISAFTAPLMHLL